MSITTSACCFLKLAPASSSPPANPKQQLMPRTSDRWLARRWVAGIACVAIGIEIIGSVQYDGNLALAIGDPKWSDKRNCPAWQLNSLETVVPENLPRPSAKRRWEIVGFDSSDTDPTTMRIRVFRNGNGCFSM